MDFGYIIYYDVNGYDGYVAHKLQLVDTIDQATFFSKEEAEETKRRMLDLLKNFRVDCADAEEEIIILSPDEALVELVMRT